MRILGTKKRFAAVATTTAAVLIGSGVAVAFWTTTGSGSGTADIGNTTGAITFQVSATDPIDALYPGADEDFVVEAVNNTDGDLTVDADVVVALGDNSGLPVGCLIADFSISGSPLDVGTGLVVPANGSIDVPDTATISMDNTLVNQDACKDEQIALAFS